MSPRKLRLSRRILAYLRELDEMKLSEVEAAAREMGLGVEYKALGSGLYLVLDGFQENGYFKPSLLSAYFYCARRIWLAKRHGDLKTMEGLKALLRGKIIHKLWQEEHPEFQVEVELLDEEEKVHGVADALLLRRGRAVLVELKTCHRVTLGHKLQVMLYEKLVKKLYNMARVESYIIYRYGVLRVGYSEPLLDRYVKRVKAVLSLDTPPPVLPRDCADRCEACPYKFICASYPRGNWDRWLTKIGDYPISRERCGNCPYLWFCRAFKARAGEYPCESKQKTLA